MPTVRVRSEMRRFRARMRATDASLPQAARRAVLLGGAEVAASVAGRVPRSTHRVARAAAQTQHACVRLGAPVAPMALPALTAPAKTDRIWRQLRADEDKAKKQLEWYDRAIASNEARPGGPRYKAGDRKGRLWESHERLVRGRRKALRVVERIRQTIDDFDAQEDAAPVLAIGGRRSRTALSGRVAKIGYSNLTSLRTKVYGGTAEYARRGTTSVVTLRNREPHARFVERGWKKRSGALVNKPGTWAYANSIRTLRVTGTRRMSRAALKVLIEGGA
jgi:hypothetical protein